MAPPVTEVWDIQLQRPRKNERLSWPGWLTYSGRFTHINGHPSATGLAQDRESSTAKHRCSTDVPQTQLRCSLVVIIIILDCFSCFYRRMEQGSCIQETSHHRLLSSLIYRTCFNCIKKNWDTFCAEQTKENLFWRKASHFTKNSIKWTKKFLFSLIKVIQKRL